MKELEIDSDGSELRRLDLDNKENSNYPDVNKMN